MKLTARYGSALAFALEKHAEQFRKKTEIPYFSHVVAVSSLAMEHGASEDQAIAALLHDTIEDCGVSEEEIAEKFGTEVVRIVVGCTDSETIPKPPWKERKKSYIAHLESVQRETILVSACDKLHNARAIVRDVSYLGASVWSRFTGAPNEILWYYESLYSVIEGKIGSSHPALVGDLKKEVSELRRLVPTDA